MVRQMSRAVDDRQPGAEEFDKRSASMPSPDWMNNTDAPPPGHRTTGSRDHPSDQSMSEAQKDLDNPANDKTNEGLWTTPSLDRIPSREGPTTIHGSPVQTLSTRLRELESGSPAASSKPSASAQAAPGGLHRILNPLKSPRLETETVHDDNGARRPSQPGHRKVQKDLWTVPCFDRTSRKGGNAWSRFNCDSKLRQPAMTMAPSFATRPSTSPKESLPADHKQMDHACP